MFRIKEIVKPSGKGRTADWPQQAGTVTRVTAESVFVQWHDCAMEDEMHFDELVSTGTFNVIVPASGRRNSAGRGESANDSLSAFARQWMNAEGVGVQGKRLPIRRTSRQGLKTVTFVVADREYAAIEQNPEKPSRWGQLARSGHQVVQFKDVDSNKFVAVAVDGEVKEYGGGKGRDQAAANKNTPQQG